MISLYKIENTHIKPDEEVVQAELRGLSTDEKPSEINGKAISNGSAFIEIDTGKVFLYDSENEEWKEI